MNPAELVAEALGGTQDIVAVTGATGWIGSVALGLLHGALGSEANARVQGYASTPRSTTLADGSTAEILALSWVSVGKMLG